MTTTSTAKYNFGTVTLKNGSKGAAVKELQRYLNDTMSLGLKLDGVLGPKTIAVIKKWQKAHGLVVDGLVGAKTKAMMLSLTK
jgi:peptidoglycan hydrolase-like protein with peptidoglycan-binding domain